MSATAPIGVIAGRGKLPRQLVEYSIAHQVPVFVIALEGFADVSCTQGVLHLWAPMAKIGRIFSAFEEQGVKQVCLVGGIQRPNFSSLIPDFMGMKLLAALTGEIGQGDDALLRGVLRFIESQGYEVVGIDQVMKDVVATSGVLTKKKPDSTLEKDIALGVEVARTLGKYDVGQAVIVDHGHILGLEGPEGTEQLIARAGALRTRDGRSGVLVKVKKPSQDARIDLPAIGTETIQQLHQAGFAGVAVEAGSSLIIEREETIALTNELHLFITGV